MQLAQPHKGWENEHLATFLLSRLAFVASPITVADDVGTDLFCTLFDIAEHKGRPVLLPRRSIAIQIKSSRERIDIVPRLDYIARLEIPYYIGVVDQKELTLELYTARFLPALLSYKGHHSKLFLSPCDVFQRQYRPVDKDGLFTLYCHKVATLTAHDDADAISEAATAIRQDSGAALQAIASRLNKEYIFEIPGGEVEFYAGEDSAQSFRHAFFRRLAEAYFNFSWLFDHGQKASEAEMDAFVQIVDGLEQACDVPDYVLKFRNGLQERRRSVAVP